MDDASSPASPLDRVPDERHPDDLPPDPAARRGVPRGVLWAVALFIVVLTIASFRALSSPAPAPTDPGVVRLGDPEQTASGGGGLTNVELVGRPAPAADFVTFRGDAQHLASFAGKPIVLNFWASTCPPCITEMPDLERVHQQFGDRVAFIGLASNDSESGARELAARTGVTYTLGFDPTGDIVRTFGGIGLPTTVVIDPSGTVRYARTGTIKADDLTALLDGQLAR